MKSISAKDGSESRSFRQERLTQEASMPCSEEAEARRRDRRLERLELLEEGVGALEIRRVQDLSKAAVSAGFSDQKTLKYTKSTADTLSDVPSSAWDKLVQPKLQELLRLLT